MNIIENKKILLIICGGISAYKSLEIIRLLKKQGATVKSILTQSAKKFVTPLSVASLSQEKVYDDLFSHENESEMDHISLSEASITDDAKSSEEPALNLDIVLAVAGATKIKSLHLDKEI